MTPNKNRRVILLALLLASISAALAYGVLASRSPAAPAPMLMATPVSGMPVLVGARAIEPGETLAANDIEVIYVAADAIGARALTASNQAIGKLALVQIPKGEQVLAGSVGAPSDPVRNTFAREVPVGMRAVTIASEETVGVGGFVQPGDRVDVIAGFELKPVRSSLTVADAVSGAAPKGDPFPVAELIVQDVEVFAVAQARMDANPDSNPASGAGDDVAPADGAPVDAVSGLVTRPEAASVTLLVSPTEALRLLLAIQSEGMFRLLLRAPGDTTVTDLPPALITSGETPMDPFKLVGANMLPKDLVIVDARFRQASVPAGGVLEFEATVRNVSVRQIPAGSGGAGPGMVFKPGESWQSIESELPVGVYSLGVTSDDALLQTYPWRWKLGQDLAPGQSATITGGIQMSNAPGVHQWWFGTMLQPGTIQDDGVGSTAITIEPLASVVVVASTIDLRDAPWTNAKVILAAPRGTRADVLELRDGWFHVRAGSQEGWVPETAVANAVLPQAVAAEQVLKSSE